MFSVVSDSGVAESFALGIMETVTDGVPGPAVGVTVPDASVPPGIAPGVTEAIAPGVTEAVAPGVTEAVATGVTETVTVGVPGPVVGVAGPVGVGVGVSFAGFPCAGVTETVCAGVTETACTGVTETACAGVTEGACVGVGDNPSGMDVTFGEFGELTSKRFLIICSNSALVTLPCGSMRRCSFGAFGSPLPS